MKLRIFTPEIKKATFFRVNIFNDDPELFPLHSINIQTATKTQTLKLYDTDSYLGTLKFDDFNFDGKIDLSVVNGVQSGASNPMCRHFIFIPEKGMFGKGLDEPCLSAIPSLKKLHMHWATGAVYVYKALCEYVGYDSIRILKSIYIYDDVGCVIYKTSVLVNSEYEITYDTLSNWHEIHHEFENFPYRN